MPILFSDYIYKELASDTLKPSEIEKAARLKTRAGFSNELIDFCEKRLINTMNCRFCAVKTDIVYGAEAGIIDVGFGEFYSLSLYENLYGCKKAFIFAVTIGLEVDRLLARLYISSPSEHFITDALASAYAEAACNSANEILAKGCNLKRRFSPGYGDFPLELQPHILKSVNAEKYLNITLSKALMMTPKKSITAIAGIDLSEGEKSSDI